jgi:subtilisin family serine protease
MFKNIRWPMASLIALFLGIFSTSIFSIPSVASLKPMVNEIMPLTLAQMNTPLKKPCKNPGLDDPLIPPNNNFFFDCESDEIIAIFNPTSAGLPDLVPFPTREDQFREITLDKLDTLLQKPELLPYFKTIDPFDINKNVLQIPKAVNLPESKSQVCGQLMIRLFLKSNTSFEVAIAALLKAIDKYKGELKYIQPNSLYGPQPKGFGAPGQNTTTELRPAKAANWAQQEIGLGQSSIQRFRALPTVRVAVLDTGLTDPSLQILTPTPNPGIDLSNLDARPFPIPYLDDFLPTSPFPILKGHGTGVTSIIGSQDPLTGIAPNANIIPIKICKNGSQGVSTCNEASAIYATCYAASEGVEASVINMSFGTLIDGQILRAAIRDVTRSGSLVVTSAGNTRDDLFIQKHDYLKKPGEATYTGNAEVYPAFYSGGPKPKQPRNASAKNDVLLSVGAMYSNKTYAGFATVNSSIDLVAPGSWVRVLGSDGITHDLETDPNQSYSGTSFSAAYVSGAAALMIAKAQTVNKTMNALELAQRIIASTSGSYACGTGCVLNVYKALQNIR